MSFEGGSAHIPYPKRRLRELGESGRIPTLLHELKQGTIHVIPAADGLVRSDKQEGQWNLKIDPRVIFSRHESYSEALRAAKEACRLYGLRIVIHSVDGNARFQFPESGDCIEWVS